VKSLRFQSVAKRIKHPFLFRKLAGFELGIDELAVDGNLEASASGGDQLEVLDLLLVGREKLARQTDGLRFVISHRTVFEFHVHDIVLLL
jgi:hypothetical protein